MEIKIAIIKVLFPLDAENAQGFCSFSIDHDVIAKHLFGIHSLLKAFMLCEYHRKATFKKATFFLSILFTGRIEYV